MNETRYPTVLVIEDDDGNRRLISRFLDDLGYEVVEAEDGTSALGAVTSAEPDVVVLDLGLPGLDGLNVLRQIRSGSGVPILILTGRVEERTKLDGFALGADDYMVKPFSVLELSARLSALLRRGHGSPMPSVDRFTYGSLVVNVTSTKVTVDGDEVDLRPKELALLAFLMSSPGRVYSRTELLQQVWGSSTDWQDAATVTEHIRRIRRKLAERPHDTWRIETIRGFGYTFAILPDTIDKQ